MICAQTRFRVCRVENRFPLCASAALRVRTCDLRFRKPSLYPAELRDRRPAVRSGCLKIPLPERAPDRQSNAAPRIDLTNKAYGSSCFSPPRRAKQYQCGLQREHADGKGQRLDHDAHHECGHAAMTQKCEKDDTGTWMRKYISPPMQPSL
jgi:hypothetical protein